MWNWIASLLFQEDSTPKGEKQTPWENEKRIRDRFLKRVQETSLEDAIKEWMQGTDNYLPFNDLDLRGMDFSAEEGMQREILSRYRVSFHHSQLQEANFEHSMFVEPDFNFTNLDSASLRFAIFDHGSFSCAKIRDADLTEARFANSDFSASDLAGSKLEETGFQNADLRSARLTNANVTKANFTNAKLNQSAEMWATTKGLHTAIGLPPGLYADAVAAGYKKS